MSTEVKKAPQTKCPSKQKQCCCKKIPRWARIVLILVMICLVGYSFLGNAVKISLQTLGPKITGCPMKVQRINTFALFMGNITIHGLEVGNPEGFHTPNAFFIKKIHVDVAPFSLLSKKIVVNQVLVENPEITYEMGMTSNIGQILKNLKGTPKEPKQEEAKQEEPKQEKASQKSQRSILIKEVSVQQGFINLSIKSLTAGKAAPIPLPPITLHDIGKDKEMNTAEATTAILTETLSKATDTVGSGLKNTGNAIGNTTKDAFNSVKSLFGGKK